MPHLTIQVDLHHHFHYPATSAGHDQILAAIANLKETIMTGQTDAAAVLNAQADKLDATVAQLAKITTEVQALKDAVLATAGTVDPALAAAIDRVVAATTGTATAVQGVDDLNPDAPAQPQA